MFVFFEAEAQPIAVTVVLRAGGAHDRRHFIDADLKEAQVDNDVMPHLEVLKAIYLQAGEAEIDALRCCR